MVAQKEVHAEHAAWTVYRKPDGSIERCQGVFKNGGAKEHAWGMARYLNRANVTSQFSPGLNGDNDWVIVVPAGNACTRLLGWLDERGIAVGVIKQRKPRALKPKPFRQPLPESMRAIVTHADHEAGLETIRACHWEGVECGGGKLALATDIENPVQAFQAAFFLHWKKLIDKKTFDAIREEAIYILHQPDAGLLRIVVQPEQAERLEHLLGIAQALGECRWQEKETGRRGRQGLLFDPGVKR